MMPMYMSSSQPRQMRPQGYYHQGFGNPHQMTMDASSPVSCEHWPAPSSCYRSCNHGDFPACTPYWPPCYPPQIPYHTCCANHSGFHPYASPPFHVHQPFPVGYQPWYESQKDVLRKDHCTKCSPQMCLPKNNTSIVIEEHEPEIKKGDHGEAVNPVRSTDCPYPIIWIPHENARNQEHGSHDQPSAEIKVPQGTKVQKCDPKSWNCCFPFDENTIKSLVQNQDRKKMHNGKTVEFPFDVSKLKSLLQGEEGNELQIQKNKEPEQLQYPVVWIPPHGKHEDVEGSEKRVLTNAGNNLKSFPSDHSSEGKIARGNKGNFECNVLSDAEEEKSSMRNIPVDNHLQEPRKIPVKVLENHLPTPTEATKKNAKTEPVENTKKEQRLSPPKASRLPPVCLRVDPLPRRKNGGSQSPCSLKGKSQPLTSEETKVAYPLSSEKGETKTVHEACNVKCKEPNKEKKMSEERPNSTGTEKQSVESKIKLQEGVNCEIACESKENEVNPAKTMKKTFTEEEAATIIQSRFRGYDVRRWEPIKKLKEIATVREQMSDVTKRIQALEVSTDQYIEGKEIVVLGEMVMSLLLKLDSVQGLHPSIRDHRKSLARELSDLQENLDSLKFSSAEKDVAGEQVEITSQTTDRPVNVLAEEKKVVSDSNTDMTVPPFSEEHSMRLLNETDEQRVAEAEEETRLSETLATDLEPIATPTTIPEKIEAFENVPPSNPSSTDRNEMTVTTNIEEDKFIAEKLEEPLHELPQVEETTRGPGNAVPQNASEVSEADANGSENEDRKGNDDLVLPSEKDEELSELLVGILDDETQLLSEDISPCTREAETTVMDPVTESQEETNVVQETCELQEETEQPPKTQVTEHEISEETKRLMDETQRFKEMMETIVKAGKEQLQVISKLNHRVKSLEKKLSKKKKRTQIGLSKPCREHNNVRKFV